MYEKLYEEGKPTWFYVNCKKQRKLGAKICQVCPFREEIEEFENKNMITFPQKRIYPNMRKNGFYWVQYESGNWTICEWSGGQWHHKGCAYPNTGFKKVDEKQIIRNEI